MKRPTLKFTRLHKYPFKKGTLMNVSVTGLRSKKQQKIFTKAAEFYASLLLNKRTAATVFLEINFKRVLDDCADGYCHFLSKATGFREFEIDIVKGLPLDETLITLAHEMVHLKQFATNELSGNQTPANITRWQGRSVNENKVDYWDLPWEIEAHGRERGLYYRLEDKTSILK